MKEDVCEDLYHTAEELVTDVFQKHHGYIDDWFDHGYEEAVYETYTHILAYLVKKRYKNIDDVKTELKIRALKGDTIGAIITNGGEGCGFVYTNPKLSKKKE